MWIVIVFMFLNLNFVGIGYVKNGFDKNSNIYFLFIWSCFEIRKFFFVK